MTPTSPCLPIRWLQAVSLVLGSAVGVEGEGDIKPGEEEREE